MTRFSISLQSYLQSPFHSHIERKTCDIEKAGAFTLSLQSQEGCDSLVITNVKFVKSDSRFLERKTCDI